MIKIKNIVYGFLLLLLAAVESDSKSLENTIIPENSGNIVNPPIDDTKELQNTFNSFDSYNIFVPSPLEPEVFERMKKQQLNNEALSDNPIFLESPPPNLVSGLGLSIDNSNVTESEVKKIIKLQENDYQKYFDQINNIEYQKVYQSLNNPIKYEESYSGDFSEYNKILYNLSQSDNLRANNSTVNSEAIIDLPLNKKEVENLYSNVFTGINLNNSFSFVQTNKDIQLNKGLAPMYGQVDSKPKKFTPELIGTTPPSNYHEKDYDKKEHISEEKARELQELEMEKRTRIGYPRFRSLRTHEAQDLEEKRVRDAGKEEEFNQMKKRIESSFSFIQQDKDKLAQAIDYLISKRNKNTKKILENCNENCDKVCSRAQEIKGEGKEICSLKCHLACSNNAINNIFSK